MLLGPGPQDLDAAHAHLEDAAAQLLGPLTQLIPRLDVEAAAALLNDGDRIRALALLLDLEASLLDAQGNSPEAARRRERAAGFRRAAEPE